MRLLKLVNSFCLVTRANCRSGAVTTTTSGTARGPPHLIRRYSPSRIPGANGDNNGPARPPHRYTCDDKPFTALAVPTDVRPAAPQMRKNSQTLSNGPWRRITRCHGDAAPSRSNYLDTTTPSKHFVPDSHGAAPFGRPDSVPARTVWTFLLSLY